LLNSLSFPDCHPAEKNRRVGGGATQPRSGIYSLGGVGIFWRVFK
jgi:hypothetical protein